MAFGAEAVESVKGGAEGKSKGKEKEEQQGETITVIQGRPSASQAQCETRQFAADSEQSPRKWGRVYTHLTFGRVDGLWSRRHEI